MAVALEAVEMALAVAAKVLLALVLGVATAATVEVTLASTTETAEALVVEGVAAEEEDLVDLVLVALDT